MRYATLALLAIITIGIATSASSIFADEVVPGLPAPPPGWPSTLELGLSSGAGGAADMTASAPFGFRYQYLAGGANTKNGWSTWNPSGTFVTNYVDDSASQNVIPVFTYYQLRQSLPGKDDGDDLVADMKNLLNAGTMKAYWEDVKLFFLRAAGDKLVVLHVEPDLWGFMQVKAARDNAATVPVKVDGSGLAELAGLPDDATGFAQAFVRLRDRYASNVSLAYHLSVFGTGVDPVYNDPSLPEIDRLANRSAAFYKSLAADFDVVFTDASDRDAGFTEVVNKNAHAWWDDGDYIRNIRYISSFVSLAQKRVVIWQIPVGNTRMRAMNNTKFHYQDNHVEWLLEDTGKTNLSRYAGAGVIALLFGGGGDGTTCACDGAKDGVTNPTPIGNNDGTSNSPDDDGGFLRYTAAQYYKSGRLLVGEKSATIRGAPAQPIPTATPAPVAPPCTPALASAPGGFGPGNQYIAAGQAVPGAYGQAGQYIPSAYGASGQYLPGAYVPPGQYPLMGQYGVPGQPVQAASNAANCSNQQPAASSTPDPNCIAGSVKNVVETGPDGRLRVYQTPC